SPCSPLRGPPRSSPLPYTPLFRSGTVSPLGGVGLDVLAEEVAIRHRRAYPENPAERAHRGLESGGDYAYRRIRATVPDGHLLGRSEEHTSELQSRENLVCRLLPEK